MLIMLWLSRQLSVVSYDGRPGVGFRSIFRVSRVVFSAPLIIPTPTPHFSPLLI